MEVDVTIRHAGEEEKGVKVVLDVNGLTIRCAHNLEFPIGMLQVYEADIEDDTVKNSFSLVSKDNVSAPVIIGCASRIEKAKFLGRLRVLIAQGEFQPRASTSRDAPNIRSSDAVSVDLAAVKAAGPGLSEGRAESTALPKLNSTSSPHTPKTPGGRHVITTKSSDMDTPTGISAELRRLKQQMCSNSLDDLMDEFMKKPEVLQDGSYQKDKMELLEEIERWETEEREKRASDCFEDEVAKEMEDIMNWCPEDKSVAGAPSLPSERMRDEEIRRLFESTGGDPGTPHEACSTGLSSPVLSLLSEPGSEADSHPADGKKEATAVPDGGVGKKKTRSSSKRDCDAAGSGDVCQQKAKAQQPIGTRVSQISGAMLQKIAAKNESKSASEPHLSPRVLDDGGGAPRPRKASGSSGSYKEKYLQERKEVARLQSKLNAMIKEVARLSARKHGGGGSRISPGEADAAGPSEQAAARIAQLQEQVDVAVALLSVEGALGGDPASLPMSTSLRSLAHQQSSDEDGAQSSRSHRFGLISMLSSSKRREEALARHSRRQSDMGHRLTLATADSFSSAAHQASHVDSGPKADLMQRLVEALVHVRNRNTALEDENRVLRATITQLKLELVVELELNKRLREA